MIIRALLVLITLSALGKPGHKSDSVVMTDRPFIISDCKLVVAVKNMVLQFMLQTVLADANSA